jgi:arylsulfatase A-like enzyme
VRKTAVALALGGLMAGSAQGADPARPNVLLIVADDMGYSDISPFGGEIPTPNLQHLAEQGLRMSQYYTSPMSAPARSMLMTGNTNQQAGMGGMWWYQNTMGKEGYELHLTPRVTTMAERFQDAGYATLMTGKWHLGHMPGTMPTDRGFDHAFALMGGGASHYSDAMPLGTGEAFHTWYTLDGKRTALASDFYSSESYARQMSRWIRETPRDQPFFGYLAFTAPHDPLQAPDEWIAKFKGQYEEGYAPVYRQRLARLKQLGIINDQTPLPDLELDKEWDSLTKEQQRYTAKVMQVYAAMIANMDAQIGKVMETLKQTGRDKNTIVVFLTDNGANAAPGFHYGSKPEYWKQFDNSYDNIGRRGSFVSYGPHWANVSNAPYARFHKTTSGQGGINTDFIIAAPQIARQGSVSHTPMAVYDVAPTLYDLAGIDPRRQIKDKATLPMVGVSFKSYLTGKAEQGPRRQIGVELHNQVAWIDGDWKLRRLVKRGPEAGDAPWGLFNLRQDPLETHDVAASHPDEVRKLSEAWRKFADDTMVIKARGEAIEYAGVDRKTGHWITLDPKTMDPVVSDVPAK